MQVFNPIVIPSGIVVDFGGTVAPQGWLLCDGSAINRITFASLFNVIGVAFGVGDGSTTFNLPDRRGRFSLGKAISGTGSTLGGTGGLIDHIHTADPPSTISSAPSATVAALALTGTAASPTHTHTVDIPSFNTGSANPPFQVFNSIIKI